MSFLCESKKIFYIDSRKRLTGTDSNFTFNLNIEPDDDFDSCVILQAQIPKSYYLVSQNRNYFYLQETDDILYPIYLNPGNYSRRALSNTIQLILNDTSPNNFSYEVTYPDSRTSDDGKYIFKVSNNGGVQPKFIFTNAFMYEQLGFNKNSVNQFVNNQLKSDNVINLQLEQTLYIHSSICQNKEGDNVLQDIFAASGEPSFSNIHYQVLDIESNSKDMTTSNSNVFTFYLLDEEDNEIFLNGLNMVFTLMCYKKNPVLRMLKGYIKLQALKN